MIKKLAILLFLLFLIGYLAFTMVSFNRTSTHEVCVGVNLCVEDSARASFITTQEIERLLQKDKLFPLGKKMTHIDLRKIENSLESNPFIDKAICYKTPKGHVNIRVTQCLPILHIMNQMGQNYYLDQRGNIMLNTDYPAYLVVATGNITQRYAKSKLLPIGRYLNEDDFWNDQIEQIHILPNGDIQLIPRVGDHLIFLGQPDSIPEKLQRLRSFYTSGLNKIGWNKYKSINVELGNQIICTKKDNK